jgi:hypothetical protein
MANARTWSPEEDRQLILNWSTKTLPQLSELFDCEISTIQRRAAKLRKMGIALPDRVKGSLPIPKPVQEDKPQPLPQKPGYWSDNWEISRPSLERLMAGR